MGNESLSEQNSKIDFAVIVSPHALALIDLPPSEAARPEFAVYMRFVLNFSVKTHLILVSLDHHFQR